MLQMMKLTPVESNDFSSFHDKFLKFFLFFSHYFPMAQTVKNLPTMQENWVRSLGWEYPLEEGMSTHSSILACRIPMNRGAWRTTVMGLQRVGNN